MAHRSCGFWVNNLQNGQCSRIITGLLGANHVASGRVRYSLLRFGQDSFGGESS